MSVYYPFPFKLTESSMSIDKEEPLLCLKAQLDASGMTNCLYVAVEDCYETAPAARWEAALCKQDKAEWYPGCERVKVEGPEYVLPISAV